MQPSISRSKTVGLVSLPGMMSGLMFAGIDPTQAIRYQIVVMFMLISVTAISSFIASYMTYRSFYNEEIQLMIRFLSHTKKLGHAIYKYGRSELL